MSLPIIQQQQLLLQLAVDSKIITIILLESLLCPAIYSDRTELKMQILLNEIYYHFPVTIYVC